MVTHLPVVVNEADIFTTEHLESAPGGLRPVNIIDTVSAVVVPETQQKMNVMRENALTWSHNSASAGGVIFST